MLLLALTRSFIRHEFSLFSMPSIFSLCLFFMKLSGRFQSENADWSSKPAMAGLLLHSAKSAARVTQQTGLFTCQNNKAEEYPN